MKVWSPVALVGFFLSLSAVSRADRVYAGTVEALVTELARDGRLPEGTSVTPALRDVPIAVRIRDGAEVDLRKTLARALSGEWKEGTLRPDRPRQEAAIRQEIRWVAEEADRRMKAWVTPGLAPTGGSIEEMRAGLLGNLGAARERGWQELPVLGLGNTVRAVTRALGGEFLATLRPDRTVYVGTTATGITEPLSFGSRRIVDTYFGVQRDPQVRAALGEAFEKARDWFGPEEMDPKEDAATVLLTFSRSPTGFIAQASAFSATGILVDRGSTTLDVPPPVVDARDEDARKAWGQAPLRWDEETRGVLAAVNPDGPPTKFPVRDPLIGMARAVAEAVPPSAETECIVVVPPDSWLPNGATLKGEGLRLGPAIERLGRDDGYRIDRDGRTFVIGAALAQSAERERVNRPALREYFERVRREGSEDLRGLMTVVAKTSGRRGMTYLGGIRRVLEKTGVSTLTIQAPTAVIRWLAGTADGEYAALFRESMPVGRFAGDSSLLQATLDAWAPFTMRGPGVTRPEMAMRACLWPVSRMRGDVGVRLIVEESVRYAREEWGTRDVTEAADFIRSMRSEGAAGEDASARLEALRVRAAAIRAVSLVLSPDRGTEVKIPVAELRVWKGAGAPLKDFPELLKALRGDP